MIRIRASKTLLDKAWSRQVRLLQQAIGKTNPAREGYPQGYRHEQTDGWSSTERAWQPVYEPDHRPPIGFTPNPS